MHELSVLVWLSILQTKWGIVNVVCKIGKVCTFWSTLSQWNFMFLWKVTCEQFLTVFWILWVYKSMGWTPENQLKHFYSWLDKSKNLLLGCLIRIHCILEFLPRDRISKIVGAIKLQGKWLHALNSSSFDPHLCKLISIEFSLEFFWFDSIQSCTFILFSYIFHIEEAILISA